MISGVVVDVVKSKLPIERYATMIIRHLGHWWLCDKGLWALTYILLSKIKQVTEIMTNIRNNEILYFQLSFSINSSNGLHALSMMRILSGGD